MNYFDFFLINSFLYPYHKLYPVRYTQSSLSLIVNKLYKYLIVFLYFIFFVFTFIFIAISISIFILMIDLFIFYGLINLLNHFVIVQ